MSERVDQSLPAWARVLDVVGLGFLLVGLSVILTGGFREWTPIGRISVTSWVRPFAIGVVALLVRHWMVARPSLPARLVATFHRWRTSQESQIIWPIFLSTRVGVLIIGFLGIVLIGYAPNTPPWRVYPNDFLNLPARWDAGWYLGVALEGYEWRPSQANRQQNIAFFPMFPMLMRYGALFAARQTLWVGVAVSFIAFFFALRYLFRLAREWLDDETAGVALALLATYPFALFYSAAYTEALFLLATVAACYHFERDQLWKAGAWGLVAGLTRPNGCLLSIVLALIAVRPLWGRLWPRRTTQSATGHDVRTDTGPEWRMLADRVAVAATPGIGMLFYSTFIYFLTGNPLQWAAQNAAWGRVYKSLDLLVDERVTFVQQYGFYDYASTRGLDMVQAIAVVFVLISVWPVYRRFGAPYAALILLNVLPPLAMGGLLSMGRVTSVLFPTFLWLATVIPPTHRAAWLSSFAMLQALFAIAYFTWRPLY